MALGPQLFVLGTESDIETILQHIETAVGTELNNNCGFFSNLGYSMIMSQTPQGFHTLRSFCNFLERPIKNYLTVGPFCLFQKQQTMRLEFIV